MVEECPRAQESQPPRIEACPVPRSNGQQVPQDGNDLVSRPPEEVVTEVRQRHCRWLQADFERQFARLQTVPRTEGHLVTHHTGRMTVE